MPKKTNTGSLLLTALVTALVVGGGFYAWENQAPTGMEVESPREEEEAVAPEFGALLYEKENYDLPFGAAEIEGYYTSVERETSLDASTPRVTCSAFVVTDGPDMLMEALGAEMFQNPIVIGSEDFFWETLDASTEESPVKVLVTINPVFEGELIGCMSFPFSSIIEIE